MKRKTLTVLMSLFILGTAPTFAQIDEPEVTDSVIDETEEVYSAPTLSGRVTYKGEPWEGVTVIIKDTRFGGFTNEDGEFYIEITEAFRSPIVVTVRFVGLKTAVIKFDTIEELTSQEIVVNYIKDRKYTVTYE